MPDEVFVCEVVPTLVPLQCSGYIGADLRYLAQHATGTVTSCELDEVGDAPSTHRAEIVHEAAGLFAAAGSATPAAGLPCGATAAALLEYRWVSGLAGAGSSSRTGSSIQKRWRG